MSIRDLLLGLCEKLCINLAAIDLFLVGGEKVRIIPNNVCLYGFKDHVTHVRTDLLMILKMY